MRGQYKTIIILSAELATLDQATNEIRSFELASELSDFNTMPAIGHYKGTREKSLIVELNSMTDFEHIASIAFKKYEQESILYRDNENNAYLYFSNGQIEKLGQLKQVNESQVKQLDCYTETANGFFAA